MERNLSDIYYTLDNIGTAAAQFWSLSGSAGIVAFSGEMGAGKTTFIHYLCSHLHVQDKVTSPTFALINEYHFTDDNGSGRIIYHLDWYRLQNSAEAFNAGMEDCLDQARGGEAFCFIEWPEKAPELLRPPYLLARIATISMTERSMQVSLIT